MKHILFTLESFFPAHRAGTEVYVLNLCHYFKSKGWAVSVLITTIEDAKDYEYEGIPVYTFTIPKKPNAKQLNNIIKPNGSKYFQLLFKILPYQAYYIREILMRNFTNKRDN